MEEAARVKAERGCTVAGGIRLHTLADVVAHLGASGQLGLLDATEVRVRRPAAGRLLFCGQTRPGAVHDLTPVRQTGLVELLAFVPGVTLLANAGYQGLSAQTGGAVLTPQPARRKDRIPVFPAVAAAHEAERRAHAARRIHVKHGISHLKSWRSPSRYLGRREHLDTILRAVAGLVSSHEQAPRPDRLHRPPRALPAGTAT